MIHEIKVDYGLFEHINCANKSITIFKYKITRKYF